MPWLILAALGALVLFSEGAKKTVTAVEQIIERSANRSAFQKTFMDAARNVDWKGIPVKFALALSDEETGAGTGSVYLKTRNLFSITKGSSWLGPTYLAGTGLEFRIYPTLEASMADWVRLMHLPIYGKALAAALAGDVKGFATEIKKAGYDASDPQYAQNVIERYNTLTV